jgi:hypothetical protein
VRQELDEFWNGPDTGYIELLQNIMEVNEKTIVNLQDAGCPEEVIKAFVQGGTTEKRLRILALYRAGLLEGIHAEQKKLDCLDYLIFNMKKEK